MSYNSIYEEESGYGASDWRTVPKEGWSCEEWKQYHKALKKTLGKKHAIANWIVAWQNFGERGKGGSECKSRVDFHNYFKEQDIDIDSSALQELKFKTLNFFEGWGKLIKIGGYVTAGLVLFIIIAVVWSVVKNPEKWGKVGGTAARAFVMKGK